MPACKTKFYYSYSYYSYSYYYYYHDGDGDSDDDDDPLWTITPQIFRLLSGDSKSLINQMCQFGVTCLYDEVLRFKKSATLAATKDI